MNATATYHELTCLDETGDTKLIWDEANQEEIDAAKQMFETLKKKGYVAFTVNRKGDKAEQVDRFDPSLEKIIMAPQLQGG